MGLKSLFNPLGCNRFPFAVGTVIWEADGTNAQTLWFDLPQGIYELTACGAGGWAASALNMYAVGCYAGGGSGGFARVDIKIPKGRYLLFPGAHGVRNSGINAEDGTEMFVAYNGGDAYTQNNLVQPVAPGAGGGVLYPCGFEEIHRYNWVGGNAGSYVVGGSAAGGASVDPYLGYGKGCTAGTNDTGTGYIKLIYKGAY